MSPRYFLEKRSQRSVNSYLFFFLHLKNVYSVQSEMQKHNFSEFQKIRSEKLTFCSYNIACYLVKFTMTHITFSIENFSTECFKTIQLELQKLSRQLFVSISSQVVEVKLAIVGCWGCSGQKDNVTSRPSADRSSVVRKFVEYSSQTLLFPIHDTCACTIYLMYN